MKPAHQVAAAMEVKVSRLAMEETVAQPEGMSWVRAGQVEQAEQHCHHIQTGPQVPPDRPEVSVEERRAETETMARIAAPQAEAAADSLFTLIQ